jgi:hypothetical protein
MAIVHAVSSPIVKVHAVERFGNVLVLILAAERGDLQSGFGIWPDLFNHVG